MSQIEPNRVEGGGSRQGDLLHRFSLIFTTGFNELKRKGTVTRLNFEIKSLEREREKFAHALGSLAWEAHVDHPEFSAILSNLKELQIEINRLETQFGEHDTQIRDIEAAKIEWTEKFNHRMDEIEEAIVPHRQRIETINAEKEDNKIQIEELRTKQDHLSQQIRAHQKNIQELALAVEGDVQSKIELEKGEIRNVYLEKCELDCKVPFLLAQLEKLKVALSDETSQITRLDGDKEAAKRDYEHRIKDYNHEIHDLEEKKKGTTRKKETLRREMDPFLLDLGKKVETIRPQEQNFAEAFGRLDGVKDQVEARRKQIAEAESLSRAMDRSAWLKFLVVSGSLVVIVIGLILILLR